MVSFNLTENDYLYLDCIICNFINLPSQGCRKIDKVQLNWPAAVDIETRVILVHQSSKAKNVLRDRQLVTQEEGL